MRVTGRAHFERDRRNRVHPKGKIPVTVQKLFPGEDKIGILLPDGSEKIIPFSESVELYEKLLLDEMEINEKLPKKKDMHQLQGEKKGPDLKALKNLSTIPQVQVEQKESLKVISDTVKAILRSNEGSGESLPSISQDKIKEIIETIVMKTGDALFSSLDIHSEEVLSDLGKLKEDTGKEALLNLQTETLKHLTSDSELKSATNNNALPVSSDIQTVVEHLIKTMAEELVSTLKKDMQPDEAVRVILKALIPSMRELLSEQVDAALILKKVPPEKIDAILATLVDKKPELEPLLTYAKSEIKSPVLYLFSEDNAVSKEALESGSRPLKSLLPVSNIQAKAEIQQVISRSYPELSSSLSPSTIDLLLAQNKQISHRELVALQELISDLDTDSLQKSVILDKLVQLPGKELLQKSDYKGFLGKVTSVLTEKNSGLPLLLKSIQSDFKTLLLDLNSESLKTEGSSKKNVTVKNAVQLSTQKLESISQNLEQATSIFQEKESVAIIKESGLKPILQKLGYFHEKELLQGNKVQKDPLLQTVKENLLSFDKELQQMAKEIRENTLLPDDKKEELMKSVSKLRLKNSSILNKLEGGELLSRTVDRVRSDEQIYMLPIDVGGEPVHLRVSLKKEQKRNSSNRKELGTKVDVAMELKHLGRVEGSLSLKDKNSLTVVVRSDNSDTLQYFREHEKGIYDKLISSELTTVHLYIEPILANRGERSSIKQSRVEFTG